MGASLSELNPSLQVCIICLDDKVNLLHLLWIYGVFVIVLTVYYRLSKHSYLPMFSIQIMKWRLMKAVWKQIC